jgi:cold shock CspA family protein
MELIVEGVIKLYKADQGYGFIHVRNQDDHFFHITDVDTKDAERIDTNVSVQFDSSQGAKGKEAKNIRVVAANTTIETASQNMSESTSIEAPTETKESESGFAYGRIVKVEMNSTTPYALIEFSPQKTTAIFSIREAYQYNIGDPVSFDYSIQPGKDGHKNSIQASNVTKIKKLIGTLMGNTIIPLNVPTTDYIEFLENDIPRTNDGRPRVRDGDFVSFIIDKESEGHAKLINKAYSLHAFAALGDESQMLHELADIVLQGENWSYENDKRHYPILWNYIFYTFERLQHEDAQSSDSEKKISVAEMNGKKIAIINTGHIDKFHKWVFMVFEEVESSEMGIPLFRYVGFCTEGGQLNGKRYLSHYEKLPPTAKYFKDFSELIFDPDLRVDMNAEHILEDRRNRLPEWMEGNEDLSEEELLPILYDKLKRAVEQAQKRVKWNYKAAIPQYFPTTKSIQFLLPLYEGVRVIGALTVERDGKVYIGRTVLTLEQAYNNARLIARPDNDWLTTKAASVSASNKKRSESH